MLSRSERVGVSRTGSEEHMNRDCILAELSRLLPALIHDLQAVGRASVSAGMEQQGKTTGLSGLSANHLWFLTALRKGPQSVRSLADGLGVSSPAATQLANRLEEHGLIWRHRDTVDRRVVLVDCSPAGERLVDLIVGDFTARLGNALSRLTDEEVRKVFEGCWLFSQVLGEAPRA